MRSTDLFSVLSEVISITIVCMHLEKTLPFSDMFGRRQLLQKLKINVARGLATAVESAGDKHSKLPVSARAFLARVPGKPAVTYSRAELLEGFSSSYKRLSPKDHKIGLYVIFGIFIIPHFAYYIGMHYIYLPFFHKRHVNWA